MHLRSQHMRTRPLVRARSIAFPPILPTSAPLRHAFFSALLHEERRPTFPSQRAPTERRTPNQSSNSKRNASRRRCCRMDNRSPPTAPRTRGVATLPHLAQCCEQDLVHGREMCTGRWGLLELQLSQLRPEIRFHWRQDCVDEGGATFEGGGVEGMPGRCGDRRRTQSEDTEGIFSLRGFYLISCARFFLTATFGSHS